MLVQADEARAEMLLKEAQNDVNKHWEYYQQMASMHYAKPNDGDTQ
jgi:hypothetical protein